MKKQMGEETASIDQKRLDLAARAAWLAYVQDRTQDEIASELKVSRQNVQRLIALARALGLIKFRLDHSLSECIALAQDLRDTFSLRYAEVAPGTQPSDDNCASIGLAAARCMETLLTQKAPLVLGLGTGRSLRAAVRQMPSMDRPQHRIVSLVGNVGPDGRASPYDVVMRLSDRIGAQCYPLPMPIVADSGDERAMLQAQRGFRVINALSTEAKIWLVGIGEVGWNGSLRMDGFINDAELAEMMEKGAIGEILGWAFDSEGQMVHTNVHDRLTAVRLTVPIPSRRTLIAVSAGMSKVSAIFAALRGGLINGLITDEKSATAVLECHKHLAGRQAPSKSEPKPNLSKALKIIPK
jgi:DNA-binding transcriptional regulator LsrR (DeoR family)